MYKIEGNKCSLILLASYIPLLSCIEGVGVPVLTGRTAIIDCKRGGASMDMNDHRFRSTFVVSPILATVD